MRGKCPPLFIVWKGVTMKVCTRTVPKSPEFRRNDKKDAPFAVPGAKMIRKAMAKKLTMRGR